MSLDIAPLLVEGTEDVALPSRGDFVSIPIPRCRVWRLPVPHRTIRGLYVVETVGREHCAACDDFCRGGGAFSTTHRRRFSRTLAPWRMTALIATITDTITTRITSSAAIIEPKNSATSKNPTTAAAINSAAIEDHI